MFVRGGFRRTEHVFHVLEQGIELLKVGFSFGLVIGVAGYILLLLGFHPAPILLGFVLGPRFEENFRRAMLLSRGDLKVFIERPISAAFLTVCVLLLAGQLYVRWRSKGRIVAVDAIAVEES